MIEEIPVADQGNTPFLEKLKYGRATRMLNRIGSVVDDLATMAVFEFVDNDMDLKRAYRMGFREEPIVKELVFEGKWKDHPIPGLVVSLSKDPDQPLLLKLSLDVFRIDENHTEEIGKREKMFSAIFSGGNELEVCVKPGFEDCERYLELALELNRKIEDYKMKIEQELPPDYFV